MFIMTFHSELSINELQISYADLVGKPVGVRVLFRALCLWNKKPSHF